MSRSALAVRSWPGVQKPHWMAPFRQIVSGADEAFLRPYGFDGRNLPSLRLVGQDQARVDRHPIKKTVHAPQSPFPQPSFTSV